MIGLPRLLSLRRDKRGVTIVEFAMVAPVMILLIMGLGELMYTVYAQSVLSGAVQKAARDSAIQGGSDRVLDIDAQVMEPMYRRAHPITISRASAPNALPMATATAFAIPANVSTTSTIMADGISIPASPARAVRAT
jgi:Flp pilus assembly protein TadG